MMVEFFIKQTSPVYDDKESPKEILGWDIVYAGQWGDLYMHSVSFRVDLDRPIPASEPVPQEQLLSYINEEVEKARHKQNICEGCERNFLNQTRNTQIHKDN